MIAAFSPIVGGLFGLDLAEGFAMFMFVVFMAMILTGYNVAFSFAATGVVFAFLGVSTLLALLVYLRVEDARPSVIDAG